MSRENEGSKAKADFKKKGLGWIPDYPDIRDYELFENIQKQGRLNKEQVTDDIENLSENFIEIIDLLRKLIKDEKTQLECRINQLENQVLGDIRFISVRLYKSLREQVKSSVVDRTIFSQEQSEFSRQILKLKKYLSILVLDGVLQFDSELPRKLELDISDEDIDFEMFKEVDKIRKLIQWIEEEKFDGSTKLLVTLFQKCTDGLEPDGVVGFRTISALNQCFAEPEKLKEIKASVRAFLDPENKTTVQQTKKKDSNDKVKLQTKLISGPTLIPKEIFSALLTELQASASHQLALSTQNKIFFESPFFHQEFTKLLKDHSGSFLEGLGKDPGSFSDASLSAQWIKKLAEDCKLSEVENFVEIFNAEFHVIEPIVSIIVKFLSPLAQQQEERLEGLVSQALRAAKDLFSRTSRQYKLLPESRHSQHDMEKVGADEVRRGLGATNFTTEGMEPLAEQALKQVVQLFQTSIQQVLEDSQLLFEADKKFRSATSKEVLEIQKRLLHKRNNRYTRTLYFYFCLEKYLEQFITVNDPSQQGANLQHSNDVQPNVFDKQELFEIIIDDRQDEPGFELFPTLKVQVPISTCLINMYEAQAAFEDDGFKLYLFLPGVVDLTYWASPIEDQGELNSCTAFAGIALFEYFVNRSQGKYTDLSHLFLYKAARNLMSLEGDVGASVRATMKAMALFGVPAEQYWTYDEAKVDEEPPAFCFSYAQNFQALKYFRLDYAGISRELLLFQIKAVLAAGFPCMFGLTMYTSAYEDASTNRGYIPTPNSKKDRVVGGHAVVAMGYDDFREIPYADRSGVSQGALLIRNSWGTNWGETGYGWLPYDYVLKGLTRDWWSLLKSEWFGDDSFGLGARNTGGPEDPTPKQPGGDKN